MASPPATPTEDELKDESGWRFLDSGYSCEWAESYRPGGFHPVNLSDCFKNGQYRVIRKLGYGSSSTVWLARDKMSGDPDLIPYYTQYNLQKFAIRSFKSNGCEIITQE